MRVFTSCLHNQHSSYGRQPTAVPSAICTRVWDGVQTTRQLLANKEGVWFGLVWVAHTALTCLLYSQLLLPSLPKGGCLFSPCTSANPMDRIRVDLCLVRKTLTVRILCRLMLP
jgi:hypothetical protein